MSTDKKKCPKCSRQLPVTASNCKYCGASLRELKTKSSDLLRLWEAQLQKRERGFWHRRPGHPAPVLKKKKRKTES